MLTLKIVLLMCLTHVVSIYPHQQIEFQSKIPIIPTTSHMVAEAIKREYFRRKEEKESEEVVVIF